MKQLTEKQKQAIVKRILRNFDFKKVHKVMVQLNWKWMGELPTIDDLREQAERLLVRVINDENCLSWQTGGFIVAKRGECLELAFYLETSETVLYK